MAIAFKPQVSFRGNYSFRNSPEAVRRFPFPFHQDSYMYSVNMEPHAGGPVGSAFEHAFDIDEHYLAELEDRRITLVREISFRRPFPRQCESGWGSGSPTPSSGES